MKKLMVATAMIGFLFSTNSTAQRIGVAHPIPGARPGGSSGTAPGRETNSYRGYGLSNRFAGLGGYGYFGSPLYSGDYGYLTSYSEQTAQVMALPDGSAVEPPAPVRPEMHEYQWASAGSDHHAVLTIVSKAGPVHHATAVWVQETTVRFIDPNGAGGELPLSEVNRERTYQLNGQQNLRLPLPDEIGNGAIPLK